MAQISATPPTRSRNRLQSLPSVPRSSRPSTNTDRPTYEERNGLAAYMKDIGKTELLTVQEEIELAARIKKGDQAARDHMISANLRLVVKIAHDYNNFGLPLLDLISEGNIGLIKAVERFDPSKGGKLSTYAAWWIKQSMKRALANQSKTIRLPVHLVDKIAQMRRITAELADQLDREPTDEEIAYTMGMPINKVAHLKSVSLRPSSLDAPVGENEDTSLGDLVQDDNQSTPLEKLQKKSLSDDMNVIISHLDAREADIIRLRFGLDGEHPMTLEEVGEHFEVTRERVRQIQSMAIHKMRRMMTENERQRTKEEVLQERIEEKKLEVIREFFAEHS